MTQIHATLPHAYHSTYDNWLDCSSDTKYARKPQIISISVVQNSKNICIDACNCGISIFMVTNLMFSHFKKQQHQQGNTLASQHTLCVHLYRALVPCCCRANITFFICDSTTLPLSFSFLCGYVRRLSVGAQTLY